MQAQLGDNLMVQGKPFRIVRIITGSSTLYERLGQPPFVVEETYLQLKGPNNEVEFLMINSTIRAYEGESSPIKGLEPLGERISL